MSRYKIVVACGDGGERAHALFTTFAELLEPAPAALTLFEAKEGWRIEAYGPNQSGSEGLARQIAELAGLEPEALTVEPVPDENWVARSQSELPPVRAGRFVVHGRHDRARVVHGRNTILIEAGEAFGTGHHATTRGCLAAIDAAVRRRRPRRVLDVGCGAGMLAIAAARTLPGAAVRATDIDPIAVRVAAANARINGVCRRLSLAAVQGLPQRAAAGAMPYDLVVANILAEPLIELARDMARTVRTSGTVILSGVLTCEAPQVGAAYVAAGFALADHRRSEGWSTLTLRRRGRGIPSPKHKARRCRRGWPAA